jgi:hypothetical protein
MSLLVVLSLCYCRSKVLGHSSFILFRSILEATNIMIPVNISRSETSIVNIMSTAYGSVLPMSCFRTKFLDLSL